MDLADNVMGQQPVAVTYNADTSKVLQITNPYGSGAASVTVQVPAVYANVAATLVGLAQMRVYEKTDGSYIVDYLDAAGWVISHSEAAISGVDQTLYNAGGVTVVLKSTGEVLLTEPITGGTREFAVNPEGIVVDHAQIGADNVYDVHFVNQNSGNLDYTANIIEISGNWYADFLAPVSQQVPVSRTTDFDGNVLYDFNFDNAAGSGNVHFWTNPAGNITSTTYTHSFRALLGYVSAGLAGLASIGLFGVGTWLGIMAGGG